MKPRATITSKNQMTLPKPVRELLGTRTGDQVEFERHGDDAVVMRRRRKVRLDDLAGVLGPPPNGRGLSVEEIDDGIARAVAHGFARSVQTK